jgi:site-specific DNA recombinase
MRGREMDDAAILGASVILRPGIQSLLQDAQLGPFDVVLGEVLDRISRDEAEVAMCSSICASPVSPPKVEISELYVSRAP